MTYSMALGHRQDNFQAFFFFLCECLRNISNLVFFHPMYSLIKYMYLDCITREQKKSLFSCFLLYSILCCHLLAKCLLFFFFGL